MFQLTLVLVYAIALLGPQPADRLQRPDLARPRRVLRDRRLYGGDPDGPARTALLGDAAGRGVGLLRRRLPVRPAGAAARRASISRSPPSRWRRDAADPEVQALEHWTGGVQGIVIIKPDPPFGLPLDRRPVALLLHCLVVLLFMFWAAGTCCAAASAGRWWRSATIRSRRRRWASTPRCSSR